jgi:hypothetical protein
VSSETEYYKVIGPGETPGPIVLLRFSADGSRRLLDTPPPGWADAAPQWSRDGRSLLFMRERNGYGRIMLLRDGTVYGPIVSLGYNLGFYGHHDREIVWRR